MLGQPAMLNRGGYRRAVFGCAAASISELRVDDIDRQTPGVIGLDSVHQFEQLALGGLGPNERSYLSFILAA